MNKQIYFAAGLLLALYGHSASAQKAAADPAVARAQRRAMIDAMTPAQQQAYYQQRFQERYNAATPQQQAAMNSWRTQRAADQQQTNSEMAALGIDPNDPNARQELGQLGGNSALNPTGIGGRNGRSLLISAGITDDATQKAILSFVSTQTTARLPLLKLARAAATSLLNGDTAAANADFSAYATAAAIEATRYAAALAALNQKIGYENTPRLASFLDLTGVTSSSSFALGGTSAVFPPIMLAGAPNQRALQRAKAAGIDTTDATALATYMLANQNRGFGGGGRGGRGGRGGGNAQPAAPTAPPTAAAKAEQRRNLMKAAGITDTATQDAIVAFMAAQETQRQPALTAARAAAAALGIPTMASIAAKAAEAKLASQAAAMFAGGFGGGPGGGGVNAAPAADVVGPPAEVADPDADSKVAAAYAAYQAAATAESARYAAALKDLDGKINYSASPQLQSFLTLAGVLDFEPLALGGPRVVFTKITVPAAAMPVAAQGGPAPVNPNPGA